MPGGLSFEVMRTGLSPEIDITHMIVTYADIGAHVILKPGVGDTPAVLVLPIRLRPPPQSPQVVGVG